MPNWVKSLVICFPIVSTLLVSCCIVPLYNINANAQVSANTLESVANQPGILAGPPQVNSGIGPQYIYSDRFLTDIYVANTGSDTVSVIDTTTNTLKQNLRVGYLPAYIYGDPNRADIYVANSGSGNVSVINTNTNTVNNKTIPVGISPTNIFGNLSISDAIYVANYRSDTVTVINTNTNTVNKTIPVGKSPQYIFGHPSNPYYTYIANSGSDTVSVINTTTNNVSKTIPVGDLPVHIFGNPFPRTIYVANSGSDTVSVINTTTNTVEEEIPVGNRPLHIHGNPFLGTIYVANSYSGTVSVVDATTNTVKEEIPVGDFPVQISGNLSISDAIYVANYRSDTVSVINTTTNTVEEEIPVGRSPVYIYHDPVRNDIYVTNYKNGGVTVINGETNKAVAGVTFDINPFRGGDIICNTADKDLEAPINRYLYVSSGTKCIAGPNKGFEFSSWGESLEGNSTRTINTTSGSPPWSVLLDAFDIKYDDPAATLTINRFGNYTAYYRALPPAIPSEYLIPLYGIVASTVVGLSIPSIINWRKSKKQIYRLNSYHQDMTSLYDDGKLDESDTDRLNTINTNIINAYSEGKIDNEQYTNLKNEISVLYEKIYKKRIDKLKESSDGDLNRTTHMDKAKEDIGNAYSEGKITELHYNLLNEKIANMTSKNDERR